MFVIPTLTFSDILFFFNNFIKSLFYVSQSFHIFQKILARFYPTTCSTHWFNFVHRHPGSSQRYFSAKGLSAIFFCSTEVWFQDWGCTISEYITLKMCLYFLFIRTCCIPGCNLWWWCCGFLSIHSAEGYMCGSKPCAEIVSCAFVWLRHISLLRVRRPNLVFLRCVSARSTFQALFFVVSVFDADGAVYWKRPRTKQRVWLKAVR